MAKRYYQLKNGKISQAADGMTIAEVRRDYLKEFREYQRGRKLASSNNRDYIDRVNVAFKKNPRDAKLYAHMRKGRRCMTNYIKGLIEKDLHATEK